MGCIVLELVDVSKTVRFAGERKVLLDTVSLSFEKTGLVCIIGGSGSGKTCLIEIMAGLSAPSDGSVRFDGVDLRETPGAKDCFRKEHCGLVSQGPDLAEDLSVARNVQLGLIAGGASSKEAKSQVASVLERHGLQAFGERIVKSLSAGERRKVSVIRALANDPQMLLIDDPFAFLDSQSMQEMVDLLESEAKKRLVVVATGNELAILLKECRLILLGEGKVEYDSAIMSADEPQEESGEAHGASGEPQASMPMAAGEAHGFAPMAPRSGESDEGAGAMPSDGAKETRLPDAGAEEPSFALPSIAARLKARASHLFEPTGKGGFRACIAYLLSFARSNKLGIALTFFCAFLGLVAISCGFLINNGANSLVNEVRERALRSYPITVAEHSIDVEYYLGLYQESSEGKQQGESRPGEDGQKLLSIDNKVSRTLNSLGKINEGVYQNKLDSLKEYLDTNPSGLTSSTDAIVYDYGVSPLLFYPDTSSGVIQVNPVSMLSDGGLSVVGSLGKAFGVGFQTSLFSSLPPDGLRYQDSYDVLAGRWPSKDTECVLVLAPGATSVDDYLAYQLGLLDAGELQGILDEYYETGTAPEVTHEQTFTYQDLMSASFKLVLQADCYQYNDRYGAWVNKSLDEDYMRGVVDNAQTMTVVGVVSHSGRGGAPLKEGLAYSSTLQNYLIERANETDIVKAQRENPETDVFSGKGFGADLTLADLQIGSLLNFNGDALMNALYLTLQSLDLPQISLNKALFGEAEDYEDFAADLDPDSSFNPTFSFESLGLDKATLDSIYSGVDVSFADMPAPDIGGLSIPQGNVDAARQTALALLNAYWSDVVTYSNGEAVDIDPPSNASTVYFVSSSQFKEQVLSALLSSVPCTAEQYLQLEQWYDATLAPYFEARSVAAAETIMANLENVLNKAIENLLGKETVELLEWLFTQADNENYLKALEEAMKDVETEEIDFDAIGQIISEVITVTPRSNGVSGADVGNAFSQVITSNMSTSDAGGLLTILFGRGSSYYANIKMLGSADFDKPTSVSFYAKSADARQNVIGVLDDYNETMDRQGRPENVVHYSDLVGKSMKPLESVAGVLKTILSVPFVALAVVYMLVLMLLSFFNVAKLRKDFAVLRIVGASRTDVAMSTVIGHLFIGLLAALVGGGVVQGLGAVLSSALSKGIEGTFFFMLTVPEFFGLLGISLMASLVASLIPVFFALRSKQGK